jgi:hypothetical protein
MELSYQWAWEGYILGRGDTPEQDRHTHIALSGDPKGPVDIRVVLPVEDMLDILYDPRNNLDNPFNIPHGVVGLMSGTRIELQMMFIP